MGRPKLLLPWGETSVVGHLLRQWIRLGVSQIAVVCAAEAGPLTTELDRLSFPGANRIVNPMPENGMFTSIRCAASWRGWNPEITHWVITLGDQPHLRDATLRKLLDFGAFHLDDICQPMRGNRRKHPVLLPGQLFEKLRDTSAADLKIFLAQHAKQLSGFDSDDAGLDFDMDTPEDYERIRALFF